MMVHGWAPERGRSGGNCGQPRYFYLTTHFDDAMWFANEKGDDAVLEVTVPISDLMVDPEDGVGSNVPDALAEAEISGIPEKFVAIRRLAAESFRCVTPEAATEIHP